MEEELSRFKDSVGDEFYTLFSPIINSPVEGDPNYSLTLKQNLSHEEATQLQTKAIKMGFQIDNIAILRVKD